MSRTVVVVTGASPLTARARDAVPDDALLVAADGGLDHARAAGLSPSVLVGDLDSVTDESLAWASAAGVTVVRHPVAKDATDTELAIAYAVDRRPEELVLVAGGGDRFDHAVAALGALGGPDLASIPTVRAVWGDDELHVIHGRGKRRLDLTPGTVFSVLAMHGPCRGVTVTGSRWPLLAQDLAPLVGLGVSNVADEPPVCVAVRDGVLTVIIPGGTR